jgi:hypothetical protein
MLAAPFLFVLLWSSSFIAAKAGLRHLSPLLFVAIFSRQTILQRVPRDNQGETAYCPHCPA